MPAALPWPRTSSRRGGPPVARRPARRPLRIGFLLLGLAGAAAAGAAEAAAAEPWPSPGLHRRTLKAESGDVLRYSLFVPRLEPGQTAPLVLALHYGGEVTPYYGFHYLESFVVPGFESLDAIIVAPDCPGRGWTDARSERAVLGLLDLAAREWPVDRRRTAVTGFSMGAIGAWFLVERHPERFGAAVPVAGRPSGVPEGDVPVFAIHSSRDEVIDLEPTRRAIEALRGRGVEAELVVLAGPTHYQTGMYSGPLPRAAEWLQRVWADLPAPTPE